MAEEAEGQVVEESGDAGGGVLKKYGPLALIVLVAQMVMAWALLTFGGLGGDSDDEAEDVIDDVPVMQEVVEVNEDERPLPVYLTEKEWTDVAVNPAGTNADRIVQFTVALGFTILDVDETDPEAKWVTKFSVENPKIMELWNHKPVAAAIINEVMGSKTVDELEPEFRPLVQDEIARRLNTEVLDKLFELNDENRFQVKVADVRFVKFVMM